MMIKNLKYVNLVQTLKLCEIHKSMNYFKYLLLDFRDENQMHLEACYIRAFFQWLIKIFS